MLQFLSQADAAQTANEAVTNVQDPEFWTNAMNYIRESGPGLALQVLGAIVILIAGRFIAGMVRNGLKKVMNARGVDPSLTGFLASLVYFVIMAFTFIAVVGQFGVQTASFVAILGAAGFAVGMAMQGTLGNFSSGVMLLLFRPFKAGDFVEAAGVMGSVQEISVFSTIIATPDNKKIIVPNSQVMAGEIGPIEDDDLKACAQKAMEMFNLKMIAIPLRSPDNF